MDTAAAIRIAALYRFARIGEPEAVRGLLEQACISAGVKGTLLVAREGINGTIAGAADDLDVAVAAIRSITGLDGLEIKFSFADAMPFLRMKVKLKQEIVTIGDAGVDPLLASGTYVEAKDWNALMERPDLVLIDVRNHYEHRIGTFDGAVDPHTASFRQFPDYVREQLADAKGRPVAMFCTGGIRCEKASAFMLQEGFTEVYHLNGGILRYLEDVPAGESRWSGSCFVFDERVAVGHGLAPDRSLGLCHACRRPLTPADREGPHYAEGISCHQCIDEMSPQQRASARERHRQMQIAKARGAQHIGPESQPDIE